MSEAGRLEQPCEYLPWDSEFFGVRIGRVTVGGPFSTSVFRKVDRWCEANQIDCLYLFNDGDDVEGIILAEEHGFRLVDVRVTYECRLREGRVKPPSEGIVRPIRDGDVGTLLDIAACSHRNTRFYADGHFSRERCDELYRVWLKNSCSGSANHIVVAELHRKPCGYMAVHLAGPQLGRVSLVAVADEARNRGIGSLIVYHALEWFASQNVARVAWPTQARNIGAQRLCTRWGFVPRSIGTWHHRWGDPSRRQLRTGATAEHVGAGDWSVKDVE